MSGGQTIANAAIVPTFNGSVTVVAGVAGTDILIDINGYFIQNGVTPNEFFGIYGSYGGGAVNFGQNSSDTVDSSGVRGRVTTSVGTGAAGVQGEATAGAGTVFGVRGNSASVGLGAAGVFGQVGTANWGTANLGTLAGVWGIAAGGSYNIGVLGVGVERGVSGYRSDAVGNTQGSGGVLGYLANSGVHSYGDITAGGTKSFVMPYEGKAEKQIVYIATESNEVLNATRGRVRLQRGLGVIHLPDSFLTVTDPEGWTVQLTPIGETAALAVMKIDPGRGEIVVKGSASVDVFYRVEGIRKGYKDFQAVQDNLYFMPESATATMERWPEETKRILIKNKIYNEDGTPNLETARALGWTRVWEQKETAAREAAAKAAETDAEAGRQ